ncbi:MAG: ATP-binding protein [Candidatus Amulumruptor caecigallinarius]|nr:ATP-binding protein [Candidatus Amulumruptor caecigallinarius]MCM1396519.1 ATP-binding protein [Candidatus Amulumruptor caecigallinarius]MCM1453423.1 ATP-binding protein [bacterium]
MKDLKPRRGALLLSRLIAEGEHDMQDFKHSVSDPLKIARSISAFANHRGGRLLIGVKDNGVIAGVRNEEDIYVVESAAAIYCRPPQPVTFTAYRAEGGETVIIAEVAAASRRPVEARDASGVWHAYVRVADENILAPSVMSQGWKRAASSAGESWQFTAAESWLLRRLEELASVSGVAAEDGRLPARGLTIEEYALGAHISQRTAEQSAARLYAMGVLRLVHTSQGWTLAPAPEEE